MQSIFVDYWAEFRDFRQKFRDYRKEFQGLMEGIRDLRQEIRDFMDESLKISKDMLDEVKGLRKDLQAILDERLARMKKDIAGDQGKDRVNMMRVSSQLSSNDDRSAVPTKYATNKIQYKFFQLSDNVWETTHILKASVLSY